MPIARAKQSSHLFCLLRLALLGRWVGIAQTLDRNLHDHVHALPHGTVIQINVTGTPWSLVLAKTQNGMLHRATRYSAMTLSDSMEMGDQTKVVPTIIEIHCRSDADSLFKGRISVADAACSGMLSVHGPTGPHVWLLKLIGLMIPYITTNTKALALFPRIEIPNHQGIRRCIAILKFLLAPKSNLPVRSERPQPAKQVQKTDAMRVPAPETGDTDADN